MELFLDTTNLLMSFWVGFSIICLMLIARSSLTFNRKLLIVPLTFLALYVTITNTVELLGMPYAGEPEGEFTFVTYRITTDLDTKKKYILLWIEQDGKHRLHQLPFDENMKKQLKKGKKRQKQGVMLKGKFTKKHKDRMGTNLPSDFKLYDFPYQKELTKPSN